jgi:acyl carrier protein
MKTTKKRIITIIAEHLGFNESDVSVDHNINDELGADSLDGIEIIMAIEQEFDLEISDNEAEEVGFVVKDIIAAVDAFLKET